MKIAESWLQEWVDPGFGVEALAHRLTMAGHEVEDIEILGNDLDGVVVAEVLAVDKHPDADRLRICRVSDGGDEPVTVVCGAPNVCAGMKSLLAKPGITLPNGLKLKKAKIRGVASEGMLCSAVELGLGDEADGILSLPADAPPGAAAANYLRLPDAVIDFNLTPNRGDCFSVLGIAREVAALTGSELKSAEVEPVPATRKKDTHPVEVGEPAGCPSFAGRVVRNIDATAKSPLWMTERLRRSGLRSIHPVVDVTNYVMLELGQPLHAYDLALVKGPIRPRFAKKGESVTLLDEKTVSLNPDTMVIADDSGAIGIAGIMGGLSTAVSEGTADVFFEAAFWPPEFVAGRARSYGMHTDASLRFERGVDPAGQGRAVERATALLIDIAGGEAGPLVVTTQREHLPQPASVRLRRERVARLLGVEIDDERIVASLRVLGLDVSGADDGWDVIAPSHRFDITMEVDLVEEIARVYGYDAIPETTAIAAEPLEAVTESRIELEVVAATLVARDFQEAISYSFVAPGDDRALTGIDSELVLSNPISADMSVMRGSLWPGMLAAAAANAARQQDRIRLFEIGKTFHGSLAEPVETNRVAVLAIGPRLPEQWGAGAQAVDFFDLKADLAALLELTGDPAAITFEAVAHPALQPGQSAAVLRGSMAVGYLGKLHPKHAKSFGLKRDAFVFELDADAAFATAPPRAKEVSKFPFIRRDIAVVVDTGVSVGDLVRAVESSAAGLISSVRVFDVYQGPGIEAGLKSVALGLILQETSRTLTDEEADAAKTAAVRKLKEQFAAELRD